MGTTKLTRKEILAEDPVHETIMQIVEVFRTQGKMIAAIAAVAAIVAIGGYLGIDYLQAREDQMQQQLGRALAIYHGRIDPSAPDDPFAKGPDPAFKSENAKYQAAVKEFSSIASRYASGKLGITAKYYLGLCELKLGQNNEALRSLEEVRNNSRDKTLGYLAKKVLARYYLGAGNYRASQELLDGMLRDPQCDLPKDDLNIDLARIFEAQGKRDEALKILRKAREEGMSSGFQPLITQEITRLETGPAAK